MTDVQSIPDGSDAAHVPATPMTMAEMHSMIVGEIPRLRRYARFLVRDAEQADDLVQDCLTRAIAKLGMWQPGSNMRAWLFVIMHNHYISHWRRQRRGRFVSLAEPDGNDVSMAISGNQESHIEAIEVQNAFNRLDDGHQQILFMIGVDGLRYEDAAHALGVPVGTVRSRLFRARAALRELMQEPLPNSDPLNGDSEGESRLRA
jgi:RNA polymerase sigma-70 factor (ECF subfamily)